jgi:LPS O-antigen subunit length determinant protein (WzzB/FepE family)
MNRNENEVELMDYLTVIWKRKWLIIGGTIILVSAAIIATFIIPPIWEVDAIMVPSNFFVQTEQGTFSEVVVVDPRQIASQINQGSYNSIIAIELNLDPKKLTNLEAENLRATKLVRFWLKEHDEQQAKSILNMLFNLLKEDLDRRIEVEIKGIDTKIANNENQVKQKNFDIISNEIEIAKIKQEILSAKTKQKISEERFNKIIEELKGVKERIDEIEKQHKSALAEEKEGIEALGLLLYSNEIQQNLRYYDTLDEKLSAEKIIKENLNLLAKEKEQEIKQLNNQSEKLKTEIDIILRDNALLNEKKMRINYAELVKKPASSLEPIFPNVKLFVAIAAILGFFIFTFLAFFIEYIRKAKNP